MDDVAYSAGPDVPTGVKLLTKIDTVYSGLVALIGVADAARTGTISAVTLVPYAACKVACTFAAAQSFRKSTWSVEASRPFAKS